MRRLLYVVFVSSTVIVVEAAEGQLSPDEPLHPLAEAYRRIGFMLNLEPVLWENVKTDVSTIAAELSMASNAAGSAYRHAAMAIIDPAIVEGRISIPSPEFSRASARRLFELSTVAVAKAIGLELEAAAARIHRGRDATASFTAARNMYQAFAPEIRATDPQGFLRLAETWSNCGDVVFEHLDNGKSTGRQGERFDDATASILQYLDENFGGHPESPAHERLVALPVNSPTFDADAPVPAGLPPGSVVGTYPSRTRPLAIKGNDVDALAERDLASVGAAAFQDPGLFGEPARSLGISCSTCHVKSGANPDFFVPGLSQRPGGIDVTNNFFSDHVGNGKFDPLDIPDLRGVRHTPPYGRNGRFDALRDFVRHVIVDEFNGPSPEARLLDGMVAYLERFK